MEGKTMRQSRVTLTQLMGPERANILGNVHGGIIMKLCDEAGAMASSRHALRPTVTVAVDSMSFHSAVHIGELLTVTAEVSWVGRTSIETRVVVQSEDIVKQKLTHTNTAFFVYVALDEQGRPAPVPPLLCETDEDRAQFARAAQRQATRLAQRRAGLLS
jgi:acyl-CoA hydrolase